jgi:beta-glucosidase
VNTSLTQTCRLAVLALVIAVRGTNAQETLPYQNPQAPIEDRVNDLFNRLTPDEKLALLGGTGFTTQPIPRLGVPAMGMVDAGQGVRGGTDRTQGPATAFPCGALMASTWDPELIARVGHAIGVESRNKGEGASVLLGPAVNIHRSPLGGRNAEYFSEDPFLAARLAAAYIRGLQSSGNAACIKHFACNNQETDRSDVNATVNERALREIYLPAFEAGVKEGNVWSVMSSYNQVNGRHSSANPVLLKDILKGEWAFNGLVMSDWGGVHQTSVVQAGNDLEMPTGDNMSVPKLKAALADGTVTQAAVDDSVHRILRTILRVGLLDHPLQPDHQLVNSREHDQLAFETATKGIVLLKNNQNLLPLDRARIKSIALIGEPAKKLQVGALGSPEVPPLHTTELIDGIKNVVGDQVAIHFAAAELDGILVPGSAIRQPDGTSGFRAQYFGNMSLDGQPVCSRIENQVNINSPSAPAPGLATTHFSVRWTGKLLAPVTGTVGFSFTGDDGYRVYLDGKLLVDQWRDGAVTTGTASASLEAGKSYDLRIEFYQNDGDYVARFDWLLPSVSPYADAIDAAKNSDVAVVCVSTRHTEGEGADRQSMDLPSHQADLIRAVAAANPKTIVLLNAGAPVTMNDWLPQVPALLDAWFPGQAGGAAIAAVLFGNVNPSGKLPDTFAVSRDDYSDAPNFPGANHQVNYAEGIFVGYRRFDHAGIQPLFPFGFGLSYTTFKYKNLKLSAASLKADGSLTASVDVSNIGHRAGEEVAQLYVHDPRPKIEKAPRELKGFAKVPLKPGETKTITFTLKPRDFAYFDVPGRQWKADTGSYEIAVGPSSRDLPLTEKVRLTEDFTDKVAGGK